jgi:ribosome-binding factor A
MNLIAGKALKDPRIPIIMSITKITISKDLHYAHIYFSMIGKPVEIANAVEGLNSASGYIQSVLAKTINMRFTPKIEFRYDQIEEESYRVDTILSKLVQEREHQEPEK